MAQTVMILERNTKEELKEAIKTHILDKENNIRFIGYTVMKDVDHYEAWCIVDVPENKCRLWGYAEQMGLMES